MIYLVVPDLPLDMLVLPYSLLFALSFSCLHLERCKLGELVLASFLLLDLSREERTLDVQVTHSLAVLSLPFSLILLRCFSHPASFDVFPTSFLHLWKYCMTGLAFCSFLPLHSSIKERKCALQCFEEVSVSLAVLILDRCALSSVYVLLSSSSCLEHCTWGEWTCFVCSALDACCHSHWSRVETK